MDLELRPDQKEVILTMRRFIREEIIPLERDLDPDAYELPPARFDRLTRLPKEMGFYQIRVPPKYGVGGLDTVTYCLSLE